MHFPDWYKKDVVLRWMGGTWSFAVAQELFSSHEVDSGSLLLLRSLEMDALPERGRCLDYGCGYGVLGLAIGLVKPDWKITLVDRDALAVAFSEHNAQTLGISATCLAALDPVWPAQAGGHDLILWNVPGKAGASVLAKLTGECLDALAEAGLLALVVVHPLADVLRAAIASLDDVAITHEQVGREHTVIHARRISGAPTAYRDGFADGVFDRDPVDVEYGDLAYRLTPVIGLPQYDGPDQASLMMMDAISTLPLPSVERLRVIVVRPGVGHVPMAVRSRWPDAEFVLLDRDLLALSATWRALAGRGIEDSYAMPDFEGIDTGKATDLAFATIPDQMRPPVMKRLLDDLAVRLGSGGFMLIGGDSTEVSRFLGLAKKDQRLRVRDQRKRRGASVALLERREG